MSGGSDAAYQRPAGDAEPPTDRQPTAPPPPAGMPAPQPQGGTPAPQTEHTKPLPPQSSQPPPPMPHGPAGGVTPQPPPMSGPPMPVTGGPTSQTATLPQGPGGPPHTTMGPPPRSGLSGKLVALGLVLMLGAGGVGGAVGYALADNGSSESPPAASPSMSVADGATLSEVAAAVQPSMVSIGTAQGDILGSGVVYDAEGHIVTNNHVVAAAGSDTVSVLFSDGSTAEGSVVGTDPYADLAVVKVDGIGDLTPIAIGDSDGLKTGDTVLALGSPLGLNGSVSAGIVSGLDRTAQIGEDSGSPFSQGSVTTMSGLIQTDAAINPGNSGGALVNGNGELIGINTAIYSTSGGSQGIGFAIPSSTVVDTADQLISGGSVEHAYLGVMLSDVEGGGAVVSNVEAGSPADEAGLLRGDVITSVDGQAVAAASDVVAAVRAAAPGQQLTFDYTRNGQQDTTQVTLGSRSD